MTVIEAYQYFLTKIDKQEIPTLELQDFNYWMKEAELEYKKLKYAEFETKQKRTDDLQFAVVESGELNVVNKQVALPDDYMFLLLCKVKLIDSTCNTTKTKVCKKMTADLKGYAESNYYWRPSAKNPYYQIMGDKVYFLVGDDPNVTVSKAILEYVKNTNSFYINPNNINDVINPSFSEYVCIEILNIAVRLYLENIESPRYQSALQEMQLKKD